MSRPRRVIGYARVSSAEQALGTSLEDQQVAIRAYAKARGLTVTTMYVEAESAVHEKVERRVQMQALMADVRAGDLVVCANLDRWSRDPEFGHGSVRKILAAGASFYSVDERCDPSTPEGDTMLGFRILFAREEHKRIRARTVGTRRLLRAQGYYVEGQPPYGYRRGAPAGSRGQEKNVLVVEPTEAALVKRMFRLCASGRSLTYICEALGLGRKRVWSSLHSRHYLGEIRTDDAGWIKGRHPAIVDAALFQAAGDRLRGRRYGGPRPRNAPTRTDGWILRDVARCAHCGALMGSAWSKDRDYYRCNAGCRARGPQVTTRSYVPVRLVEAQFAPLVLARLEELREELARGSEPPPARAVSLEDQRVKLQRRRERHLEAFADDLVTKAELRAALGKIDEALLRLDAEVARQPKRLGPVARRDMLRDVATLATAWQRADGKLRRKIVNVLAERVAIARDAAPVPTWRPREAISSEIY